MKRSNCYGDLTERQELALHFLALVEDRSVADLRRQAISDFADQVLADPNIAQAVRLCLRYRREHGAGRRPTVLRLVVGDQG